MSYNHDTKEKIRYVEFIGALLLGNTILNNNNQFVRWHIVEGIKEVMPIEEFNQMQKQSNFQKISNGWTPPMSKMAINDYIVEMAERYIFTHNSNIQKRKDTAINEVIGVDMISNNLYSNASATLMTRDSENKYQ